MGLLNLQTLLISVLGGGLGKALGGALGGGAPAPKGGGMIGSQMPFKMHLGITDGDAAYDTMAEVLAIIGALGAGSDWTKIWEKTVPAQQAMHWGFGDPRLPANQGYLWFASLDSGTGFQTGRLRLVQSNARETNAFTVLEIDDSRLHSVTATTLTTAQLQNREQMVPLPEKVEFPLVGEDSKLQLWYQCISVPAAEDDVGFSIPVTVYQ